MAYFIGGTPVSAVDRLHPQDVEALADAVAARLLPYLAPADDRPTSGQLVDAATVAAELGVARGWVYQHAEELGGRRLGDGRRARWRFDLEAARDLHACSTSKRSQAQNTPVPRAIESQGGPRLPESGACLPDRAPSTASAAVAVLTPRPGARRGRKRRTEAGRAA